MFLENHDQARSVSRFTDDRAEFRARRTKLLALMEACLSGTQYVYQGEEIGLVNAPAEVYPPENYLDIDSSQFYALVQERVRGKEGEKEELERAFAAPLPQPPRTRHTSPCHSTASESSHDPAQYAASPVVHMGCSSDKLKFHETVCGVENN